jgi:hypothetical protein
MARPVAAATNSRFRDAVGRRLDEAGRERSRPDGKWEIGDGKLLRFFPFPIAHLPFRMRFQHPAKP